MTPFNIDFNFALDEGTKFLVRWTIRDVCNKLQTCRLRRLIIQYGGHCWTMKVALFHMNKNI